MPYWIVEEEKLLLDLLPKLGDNEGFREVCLALGLCPEAIPTKIKWLDLKVVVQRIQKSRTTTSELLPEDGV